MECYSEGIGIDNSHESLQTIEHGGGVEIQDLKFVKCPQFPSLWRRLNDFYQHLIQFIRRCGPIVLLRCGIRNTVVITYPLGLG